MTEVVIGAIAFAAGYAIKAYSAGKKYDALVEEYSTLTDRDEKGRFKKSMRTLKHGE
jgi:hypothetical protein